MFRTAIFAALLFFAAHTAWAATAQEIETLQRQCSNEQTSQLKERRGTPSCDQLDRIYGYQRPAPAVVQHIHNDDNRDSRVIEYRQDGSKTTTQN